MNIDLISFSIGIFASLVAVISVYVTKKIAKKYVSHENIILKNTQGEIVEIAADGGDKVDIRSRFYDAMEYEKSVGEMLKSLGFEFEQASRQTRDYGYDFLLKAGDRVIAVEVKSHSRPLSAETVMNTLHKLATGVDDVLLISKNGFSNSSLQYLEETSKNVSIASGEGNVLSESVKKALEEKGITTPPSGMR